MFGRTQAESGRTGKQEQERISPNHVPNIFHFSVYVTRGPDEVPQARSVHRMAVAGAMNAWVDTEEVVFDGKSPIGNRYYVKLVTF